MKTIEERTREIEKSQLTKEELEKLHKLHGVNSPFGIGYYLGSTDQRDIDIENCVKWCENFNKQSEKIGCDARIDVESFRQWITNMIMHNEND